MDPVLPAAMAISSIAAQIVAAGTIAVAARDAAEKLRSARPREAGPAPCTASTERRPQRNRQASNVPAPKWVATGIRGRQVRLGLDTRRNRAVVRENCNQRRKRAHQDLPQRKMPLGFLRPDQGKNTLLVQ